VRVLVATVVHHAEDARILHRQIGALLADGVEVVYLAPTDRPDALERRGLRVRPVPRASGRRRLAALLRAGTVLAEESQSVDLTVVHDLELTLLRHRIHGPALWDVHEDVAAQVADKAWIPGPLRGPACALACAMERRALARFSIILAEPAYADRLGPHPVVRNTPVVPDDVEPWSGPDGDDRVVYVGRVSRGRGADLMATVASRLPAGTSLDVVGPVDPDAGGPLVAAGVRLRGFRPNPEALAIVGGARAGLALLEDLPNYRHSTPTKVLEYLAHGVPVVVTPLAESRRVVEASGGGFVVPFGDADAVVEAIGALGDPEVRARVVASGRRWVTEEANWTADAGVLLRVAREAAAA